MGLERNSGDCFAFKKVKCFSSPSIPWEAQSVLPDVPRELVLLSDVPWSLPSVWYWTNHFTLQNLYLCIKWLAFYRQVRLSWKDGVCLFWFGFFERYSGLCNWQMISCLDMQSYAVNYKCFLFLNPEYLTKWVWSALGKLQHKHWWALTSRTSEEGKEIRALVHQERISLPLKKKNQNPNTEKCQFSS